MAAERGWPPGGIRAQKRNERESEREGRWEEGSQAQAGRVIIILQTTAAGTYLYNSSPSFAFEPSSRSFLPPRSFVPSSHSPPLLSPASFSRRDSRTRYLSSPRAIRTNGRIRQLSRYKPPSTHLARVPLALHLASRPSPPSPRPPPPSVILPPVALPRSPSLALYLSVSVVFSVYTIP